MRNLCAWTFTATILCIMFSYGFYVFVMHFLNAFWHGNEAFPKVVLRMKLFLSL